MGEQVGVFLDTDIGDDIDDAWAVALCLRHPRLDLLGVTTVHGPTRHRAGLARWLVEASGKKVEVASGLPGTRGDDGRFLPYWAAIPESQQERVLKGRTDWLEFLKETIRLAPYEEVVLLTVGALTNAAALFGSGAAELKKVKEIVAMVGVIEQRAEPEYNAGCDPAATQAVFASGKSLTMVGLDVTMQCVLSEEDLKVFASSNDPLIERLMAMTEVWRNAHRRPDGTRPLPVLHDVLAALVIVEPELVTLKPMKIEVDEKGRTRSVGGTPNARVAIGVRAKKVMQRVREVLLYRP
ncbi:MAG: nucleoside hydrolase [Armatimonadetes bacterium]|nr:nucleoside hydrolase [Armatimonadota bacterium]MDW8121890.1 nucleoside hydrolase [Armatimonadota bacterium]